MINGETGFQVDYELDDTGHGVLRGDLTMMMSAYLAHSLELTDAAGEIIKVVIDNLGDGEQSTTFHVRGEISVPTAVE